MNITLFEVIEHMPSYEKFMKELVSKKRTINHEDEFGMHYCR